MKIYLSVLIKNFKC